MKATIAVVPSSGCELQPLIPWCLPVCMTEADDTQRVLQTTENAALLFILFFVKEWCFYNISCTKSHCENFSTSVSNLHKFNISIRYMWRKTLLSTSIYDAGSGSPSWPYVDCHDVRLSRGQWVQSDRDACRSRSTVAKVTQPVWGQGTAAGDRCTVRHERLTRTRRAWIYCTCTQLMQAGVEMLSSNCDYYRDEEAFNVRGQLKSPTGENVCAL